MGKNIANITNVITVIPDDALVYIGEPGGSNPDPYQDAIATAANLKAPLQSQIDDNETDILDHEDRIQTLENGLTKTLNKSQSSAYTITQTADSRIISFGFRLVSGTPLVKVGTTAEAEDIVSSGTVTGLERTIDISEYVSTSRTLYITINSGTVDVVRFSRENLYDV